MNDYASLFGRLVRFAPIRDPKPIPPAGIDDDPQICVKFNRRFLPYILGVLEVWDFEDLFEGTAEDKAWAIAQFQELKYRLMTATEDCGDDDMACNCGGSECICDALQAIAGALVRQAVVGEINSETPVPSPFEELPEQIGMPGEETETPRQALDSLCYAIARFLAWVGNAIDTAAATIGIAAAIGGVIIGVISFFAPIVGFAAGLVFASAAIAANVLTTAFLDAAGNGEAWDDIACAMYKALHGAPMSPGGIEYSIHNTRGNLQTSDGVTVWDGIVALTAGNRYKGLAGIAAAFLNIYESTLEMIEASSPLLSDEDCTNCQTCCNRWDFRLSAQTWERGEYGLYQQGHGLKSEHKPAPDEAARMDWNYECAEVDEGRYWGHEITYTVTQYFIDRPFTTGPTLFLLDSGGDVVASNSIPVGRASDPLVGVQVHRVLSDGETFFSALVVSQNSVANLTSDRTEVTIHTIEIYCEEQEE